MLTSALLCRNQDVCTLTCTLLGLRKVSACPTLRLRQSIRQSLRPGSWPFPLTGQCGYAAEHPLVNSRWGCDDATLQVQIPPLAKVQGLAYSTCFASASLWSALAL